MDIVEATNDFQDWELLQTSSDSVSEPVSSPDHVSSFDEIDSSGLIQTNYFSLGSGGRYGDHVHDGDSVDSDPGLGEELAQLSNKEPGEFWPDSTCGRSEDGMCRDLVEENESKFEEKEVRFEVTEGKGEKAEDLGDSCMKPGVDSAEFSDLGENSEVGVEVNLISHVDMNENEGVGSGGGVVDGAERKKSGKVEKKGIVWWKMPMEFVKHCMIRMSPVWTVSVAAAVMGFLILGRRWYQMKRKTRGLEIKVAVNDKKASQVMSGAARLNEAFSAVKLVPVIRPSLPAPAVGWSSNWAIMRM